MSGPTTFIANATGNGEHEKEIPGGKHLLQIGGTFDGATVTLGVRAPWGAVVPLADGVITAPTAYVIDFGGTTARLVATIAGAGAGTDISASV